MDTSEKALEAAIECALLLNGPDACEGFPLVQEPTPEYLSFEPGGYRRP